MAGLARVGGMPIVAALIVSLLGLALAPTADAQRRGRRAERPETLGLEGARQQLETPAFNVTLIEDSHTLAELKPKGADGFDFAPFDRLDQRASDGFYHLGDIRLRVRSQGEEEWSNLSTAEARQPVEPVETAEGELAAADLAPTLPSDSPVAIRRAWCVDDGALALRFQITNSGDQPVEIGALGIAMVFNNMITGRSLEEAHEICSFSDPYIGLDAGYIQVTRLNGAGPALVVVPDGDTPLEGYQRLREPMRPNQTFEGHFEWMAHTKAYAEDEWSEAEPWNEPTAAALAPGESRTYGVRFLLSDSIRQIEETLADDRRPVAVGVPGYILPRDIDGRLFVNSPSPIESYSVAPEGALQVSERSETPGGWEALSVKGDQWGRSRLTLRYADGREQTIHYYVVKPAVQVVDDLGSFLMNEQWFVDPDDPFGRSPSVISYDRGKDEQVVQESRVWIAGLGDEGGSGSWLAASMKQLVRPDEEQLDKYQRFVDEVLWGGLQVDEGPRRFGVRKSLFYYEPDELPDGYYRDDLNWGSWTSWNKRQAASLGRSYNYPHVAATHWAMYRLARNHEELVTDHPWEWYLERAYQTGIAMHRFAGHYGRHGQMEGTVYLRILEDLKREGWDEAVEDFEGAMRERAQVWRDEPYPFGSEMAWDSTGQEEVYAWCKYFGYDQKAQVSLNSILAYMPTVPHWGYNGCARRYWDFLYAGKLSRIERQLHHYGSGLNALPVLTEYREHPDDFYLLRVGYGGMMGALSNIDQEGFASAAFHSFPSTLRWDELSGDYGSNFLGHALNTGTYLIKHPEFGWQAFGGNVSEEDETVTLTPLDAKRQRVYLAEQGLWLTLGAGRFQQVVLHPATGQVEVHLAPADEHTPAALLRVEHPAADEGGAYQVGGDYANVRGAVKVPLDEQGARVAIDRQG